jgi:hypothetical protein
VLDDWVPPFDRRQLALWEIDGLRRAYRESARKPATVRADARV